MHCLAQHSTKWWISPCRKGAQYVPKAVHRSGCRHKHNWPRPLTPQSIMPSLNHCDLLRHVGVNNLPKVVTRQCRGQELNSQPASCKSNALATRLPRQSMFMFLLCAKHICRSCVHHCPYAMILISEVMCIIRRERWFSVQMHWILVAWPLATCLPGWYSLQLEKGVEWCFPGVCAWTGSLSYLY